MIAYHLYRSIGREDFNPSFSEGMILNLPLETELVASKFQTLEELNYLMKNYPSGISVHGIRYLSSVRPDDYNNDHTIESIFELVRQEHYPDQLSRFQAFFACPTIESAMQWSKKLKSVELWEIEAIETPIAYDARFLTMSNDRGFSLIRTINNAHQYWRHKMTSEPLPELLLPLPLRINRRVPLL